MIDRAFIKNKMDLMLGDTVNTLAFGWDIILETPNASSQRKQYPLKALVESFDDEYLKNNTAYNEDSRLVKIFLKDLEALRGAGNQISLGSLKENKSTIKIDNKNYSIIGESLQGNRRIYVFKCNRMT